MSVSVQAKLLAYHHYLISQRIYCQFHEVNSSFRSSWHPRIPRPLVTSPRHSSSFGTTKTDAPTATTSSGVTSAPSTRWPSVFSQVLLALLSSLFQSSIQQRSTPRVMHDLKYHYFPTPGKLVKRKQRKSSTYLPGRTVVEIGMLHVVEKEFVHEMLNCFF